MGLYEIYGLSVILLCAIWDSLTMLLIHRNRLQTPPDVEQPLQDTAMIPEGDTGKHNDTPTHHAGIYPSVHSYHQV